MTLYEEMSSVLRCRCVLLYSTGGFTEIGKLFGIATISSGELLWRRLDSQKPISINWPTCTFRHSSFHPILNMLILPHKFSPHQREMNGSWTKSKYQLQPIPFKNYSFCWLETIHTYLVLAPHRMACGIEAAFRIGKAEMRAVSSSVAATTLLRSAHASQRLLCTLGGLHAQCIHTIHTIQTHQIKYAGTRGVCLCVCVCTLFHFHLQAHIRHVTETNNRQSTPAIIFMWFPYTYSHAYIHTITP